VGRASAWIKGHDQPTSVNEPVPAPDELVKDLWLLDSYVDGLIKKRGRKPR